MKLVRLKWLGAGSFGEKGKIIEKCSLTRKTINKKRIIFSQIKRKPGKRYKIIRNCIFFPVFIILAKNLCTFEC